MAAPVLAAVVLGIDTPIGLAIIRDLGARGVPVVGIGRSSSALGMASKYLQRGVVRADGQEVLLDQLDQLLRETGGACLFAISEGDIAFLNRHRERLAGYRLMFPDAARMDSVLDKALTYAAAARVDIRVPRTEQPCSMDEVRALAPGLRYPVVLKWANPNQVMHALSRAGCTLDKVHYCYTEAELLAYLQGYERAGIYPLIQEYCGGYGLGQFVLMRAGAPVYTFQHRRVHEWPPEGGFSSLCESVASGEHALQMEKSIALLRALEWEGVAMIEYRHDPASGEYALMEINGRFWGSLPLAIHAGASFPWLMYNLFGLEREAALAPYRAGLRCRFMIPEAKRLLRILFARHRIVDRTLSFNGLQELLGFAADFVRPSSCYYVYDGRDSKPFFSDLAQTVRKALGRAPRQQ